MSRSLLSAWVAAAALAVTGCVSLGGPPPTPIVHRFTCPVEDPPDPCPAFPDSPADLRDYPPLWEKAKGCQAAFLERYRPHLEARANCPDAKEG